MGRLRRFLRLSATERWLLIKATLLLAVIRLGLWVLPFKRLRSLLTRATEIAGELERPERLSLDRLAWAVTRASRHVPKATCLTQALAAEMLLARHGYPACLRIGFARDENGRTIGHAWLESKGEIVVGGEDLSHFTRLPAMEEAR